MGLVDTVANFVNVFGNDPSLSTEHTTDITLEHVEGVVDSLLLEDNPGPPLGVLGEHLAKPEASVLILEQDSTRVNEFLGVLSEHTVSGRCIVHVRETVTVGSKGVADLLELGLNTERLVKDDEYALFHKLSSLWVGNGLLNGSKAHVAVTTGGTEDHALKARLLLSRHDTGNARKAHVHIVTLHGFFLRAEEPLFLGVGILGTSSSELRHSQTGSVRHEETARLLENLLELNLFVVLRGEFLGIRVELLELSLISLKLNLQGFEELRAGLILSEGSTCHCRLLHKGIDIACRLQ
mmetsp:Transcript_16339/g.29734  ORF Transcript_16339/g.29734 Transcript_16339/m.29734 type:complete len:295 (+) Transcript_16339:1691-2575(+)